MVEQRPFKALVVGSSPTQPIFSGPLEARGNTGQDDKLTPTHKL